MNRIKQLAITLAVVISLFMVFSQMVYASVDAGTSGQTARAYYLEPGTFTIIMQAIVGLLIGGAAMVGIYRKRVKNFLTNLFTRRRQNKESEEIK